MKVLIVLACLVFFALAADYSVIMKEQVDFAKLKSPISNLPLNKLDFLSRGRLVTYELMRTAQLSQKSIIEYLQSQKANYASYWVTNSLIVKEPTFALLKALRERDDVKEVVLAPIVHLIDGTGFSATPKNIEWNVEWTKAPKAWERGVKGQGVIVGVLDTGLNYRHEALVNKYRGNNGGSFDHDYNWFDGVTRKTCRDTPCDQHSHGSHVSGTVLGSTSSRTVGMAPDAKLVSCRSFATGSASSQDIMNCFQWFLAPTKRDGSSPNPDKRPHVINHSWGSSRANSQFSNAVKALHAAGTLNVFAAGNSGSRCSSLGYPGADKDPLTVGALSYRSNTIVYFSSRGPAPGNQYVKPEVVAPGHQVVSCSNRGNSYRTMSGTSMAAPAVTGSVALLYSKNKSLIGDIEGTKAAIQKFAFPIKSTACSSRQDHPNNVYGYGLVDNDKASA